MSLAVLADHMASKGRGPDSMLIHMSPREVQGLQALAVKHGGSLTVNPETGLPEAGFLDKLLPTIIGAGISFFSNGAIDPMTAAAMVGGVETVRTGDIGKGIQAGLGAYGGASLTTGFTEAGASTIGAAEAAKGLTMSPELLAEFGGDSAKDALLQQQVTDRMAAATPFEKLSSGFDAVKNNPMGMARSLATPAFMAASPILADLMVPTTTKQPGTQSNDTISQSIYDPYSGTYRRLNPVPAANYGTPAHKGFASGGMVALNSGGVPGYAGVTGSQVKDPNLQNIYRNLGGEEVYKKIADEYLGKTGGNTAGLMAIMSKYDTPVAAPAAVTPATAAATLTPQQQAMELMYRSTTGGNSPTSAFDALGGSAAVRNLATQGGFVDTPIGIANYERTMGYQPSTATVANTKLATDNLPGLYASLGGGDVTKGKAAYDKIAADYTKAGGNVANLASVLYDETAGTFYNPERLSTNSTFKANNLGYSETDLNSYINSDAAKTISNFTGKPITAESYIQDVIADGKRYVASSGLFTPEEVAKMTDKQLLAANELFTQGGGARKINGFTQQDVDFIRNEANNYGGLLWSPNFQAIGDKGDVIGNQAKTATTGTANTTGTIGSEVTSNGIVDLKTDTGVTQDKKDNTTTGINTLATTTPSAIKSSVTTDGTYTGTSGVAPTMGTLFGQGKFVGTGTEMGTGTTGPIMDFGGVSPFGLTSPMTLAKTQIAEEAAAKTAADKAKLDMYSQWGAANPKATNLEHANFVDKIGLDPAVAARLIGISPDQALSAYNDAKFNTQTGDSKAAYDYLMGKSAYPTKSNVGQIMRPYAEATLGMPANTNRQYIYDQTTGKYSRNPDYVAEYKDPSGGVNYLMSQKEIFDYFKKNANQDDATTYAWALANNLTPKDIADATGVPLSQVAAKWRAAVANKVATEVKKEDGTIDKEATDKKIAEKAAADKAAADAAADKAVKDNWDEAAYLADNPDVAAELASGKSVSGKPVKFTSGYEHFTMFGKDGGRKPTVKAGTTKVANGGLMKLAMGGMPMNGYAVGGGLGSLGSYSDGGRLLRGPGDGVSDSIPATIGRGQRPARLADGEFVVPARIVSELGNGSTEAGAKKLYAMMDRVQRARGKTTGKNRVAANSRADKYLPA